MTKQDRPARGAPERDPLSVGLGRHKRYTGVNLPPWLEEHGAWLAVFLVIVLFLIPVQMLGLFDRPVEQKPSAVIRVSGAPAKTWAEGSSTRIESVAVDVENVGPEAARTVKVEGVVRGSSFALSGPKTIEPGQRARFTGRTTLNLMSEDPLSFRLSCENCPQG